MIFEHCIFFIFYDLITLNLILGKHLTTNAIFALRFACIQRFSRRTFCSTFHSNTESFVRLCRVCVYLALVDVLFPAAVGVQSTAVVIEDKERACDSLLMCIVTVLSHGLRSGGGVGDVLRKPSKEVPHKGLNMSLGLWVFFYLPYGR